MVFTQLLGVGSSLSMKTPGGHREKGNEVTWFSLFKNRKTHSPLAEAFHTWHEMLKKLSGGVFQ